MFFYPILACHTSTEKKVVEVPLRQSFVLEIDVEPSDAEILIDNEPWSGQELSSGKHDLKITRAGFVPIAQEIESSTQQSLRLGFTMQRIEHTLKVHLPQPEPLLVHTQDGIVEYRGGMTRFSEGAIQLTTKENPQKLLWRGVLDRDMELSRCFDVITESLWCVCRKQITTAPKDVLFVGDELWISLFSGTPDILTLQTDHCAIQEQVHMGGASLLQERNGTVLALDHMSGVLREIDGQEKKILGTQSIPTVWNSSFVHHEKDLVIASWQADVVHRWSSEKKSMTSSHRIVKPKDILSYKDNIFVLSSEPAQLSLLDGTVLYSKNDAAFGQMLRMGESILISDIKNGIIYQYDIETTNVVPLYRIEEGNIRRMAIYDSWVFVAVHVKGEKFSRGTGSLHIVQSKDGSLHSIVDTQNITTQIKVSLTEKKLALADISSREILLLDITPLLGSKD